jgi:hypothetical protein
MRRRAVLVTRTRASDDAIERRRVEARRVAVAAHAM